MNRKRSHSKNQSGSRRRAGNMALLLCFLLPVSLAVAAYAINVVYMEMIRTELQIATDVAARAAGRTLAVTRSRSMAVQSADHLLALNPCDDHRVPIEAYDIRFGASTRLTEYQPYRFEAGKRNPNAVSISGKGTFEFPPIFPTLGVPIDFRPIKSAICSQTEIDLAIILDRSTSMAYGVKERSSLIKPPAAAYFGWTLGQPVPPKSRWLDAVESINQLLDMLNESYQSEKVALVTYGTLPTPDVQLTTDFSQVRSALNFHSTVFLGGTTDIGDGILFGTLALSNATTARAWATRAMIVITDGKHSTGIDPIVAAEDAASNKIMIFTITYSDEADIEQMKQVAAAGKGKHFHASTGKELTALFKEVTSRLPILLTH